MKNIAKLSVLLMTALVAVMVSCKKDKDPTLESIAGSGTSGDPYLISTAAQLAKLAELVNAANANYNDKYYRLANDIDLSAYGAGFNNRKGWIPIGFFEFSSGNYNPFMGNFDGAGYKVSGLYINDSNLDCVGLFGIVWNGTIANLGVTGADIRGYVHVGGVAGGVVNSIVDNCYATGTVSGNRYVGGVVGGVVGVMIGGVAGINHSSSVTNCYAASAVSGNNYVGGVAGEIMNYSSITNCAALNPIIERTGGTGTTFGRVVGNNGTLSNNVALVDMQALDGITFGAGAHDNLDGADITAAQAKTAAFWTTTTPTWTGWDTTVWDIEDGRLPILRNVGGNQTANNPPTHLQE